MTELKSCPFCGGKAKLIRRPIDEDYYVKCENAGWSCNATTLFYNNEEDAIEEWNKRADPWKKGKPVEEGWYDVVYKCIFEGPYYGKIEYHTVHIFTNELGWKEKRGGIQEDDVWQAIAYREIEPFYKDKEK